MLTMWLLCAATKFTSNAMTHLLHALWPQDAAKRESRVCFQVVLTVFSVAGVLHVKKGVLEEDKALLTQGGRRRGAFPAKVLPGRVGIILMLLLAPLRIAADRGGALRACGRLAVAEDGHAHGWWSARQRALLNESLGSLALSEACAWDCMHRAMMLEPLAADVLMNDVKGDFLEAGVASGGVSIHMTAMLLAAGLLGDASDSRRRKMWVADSFSGLPPPRDYINAFARQRGASSDASFATDLHRMHGSDRKARIWSGGEFAASDARVAQNFRTVLPDSLTSQGRLSGGGLPRGVHFLKGFFNESLPGPVSTLALLRADGDLYTSIYETLAALYSRLSDGGYVVFDDWPISQARQAVFRFRREHGITTPIICAGPTAPPPFQVIHLLAFWKKDASTG